MARRRSPNREGITLAKLSGTAKRLGRQATTEAEAVAELHEISRDPQLLGRAAGAHLLEAAGGSRHAAAALALLRAAGADERAIEAEAEAVRRRLAVPTFRPPPGPSG